MTGSFFANPAFREYLRLLFDLHILIARGDDESERGEGLRDRLDAISARLSQDEIDASNEFSADFYSLSDSPNRFVRNPTAQVRSWKRDALARRSQKRYMDVFGLLRKLAPYSDPAKLALQRGTLWERLSEPNIALAFYDRSRRLAPPDDADVASFFYLRMLAEVRRSDAVAVAVEALRNRDTAPAGLLLASVSVLMDDIRSHAIEDARTRLRQIADMIDDLLADRGLMWLEAVGPRLLASSYGLAALTRVYLGEWDEALAYVDAGLSVDLVNETLLTLRGILTYTDSPASAVVDLEHAELIRTASETPNPWPAIFLAHDALASQDYGRCERYAREALRIAGESSAGAKARELLAIAMDQQGARAEEVEELFVHALGLDPDNERIRRNFEVFWRRREAPPEAQPDWIRQSSEELRLIGLRHLEVLQHDGLPASLAA